MEISSHLPPLPEASGSPPLPPLVDVAGDVAGDAADALPNRPDQRRAGLPELDRGPSPPHRLLPSDLSPRDQAELPALLFDPPPEAAETKLDLAAIPYERESGSEPPLPELPEAVQLPEDTRPPLPDKDGVAPADAFYQPPEPTDSGPPLAEAVGHLESIAKGIAELIDASRPKRQTADPLHIPFR